MKPFDLELAKKNHPVQTRDGRSARIICHDSKSNQPIIALIDVDGVEVPFNFTIKGRFYTYEKEHYLDLVMTPTKKERWINIYKTVNSSYTEETDCWLYRTEKEAKDHIDDRDDYILTKKIEFEE